MYRKFITLVVAASIAVTGLTAAPARADNNDAAKVIAGVAALAIIGAVIADNKKDKRRKKQAATRNHSYYPNEYYQQPRRRTVQRHQYHHNKHQQRQHGQNGNAHTKRQQDVWGHSNGRATGHNKNQQGLRRAERRAVPSQCLRRDNHGRTVYSQRCLNQHGFGK